MIALSRRTVSRNRIRPSLRTRALSVLQVEALESRTLLSATDLASLVAFPAGHFASANFSATQSPNGYWPAQIRHAYGFDSLSYTGKGQTIAIVDAYDDPNIVADLAQFDAQYGIASANLTKATPQGQPAADAGWSSEIALDVEWAHAIAPGANLLLVEAKDSSLGNLLGAVDYAVGQGAQVVSMSWGAGEFSTETSYDYHFANHPGVTFVASVGDNGASPEWPASSPHVVAVGGTTLNLSSSDIWNSETGWGYGYWSRYYGGSGGGISRYEPKPSFQSSVTQSPLHRTIPDVSYVADPNTGLAVYDSYGSGGWAVYGGTSVGAPQWAGLVALVDQGRGIALTGDAQTLPAIYQLYKSASYSTDFHDIVSGNNGYLATKGYDLVTGVGSPRANNLVPDLVKVTGMGTSTTTPAAKHPGSATATVIINLLQPNGSILPALTPAVSSGNGSPTVVTAGNSLSVGMIAPVQGSVPFTPAPVRPVEMRIESGGGDNGALQDDDEADNETCQLSPMAGQDVAAGLPNAAVTATDVHVPTLLAQACDAWFAGEMANGVASSAAGSRMASEDVGLIAEPAAESSLLAVVLGCYWSAHFKDSERRTTARRRAVGGTV